jgi:hypothetical protein
VYEAMYYIVSLSTFEATKLMRVASPVGARNCDVHIIGVTEQHRSVNRRSSTALPSRFFSPMSRKSKPHVQDQNKITCPTHCAC